MNINMKFKYFQKLILFGLELEAKLDYTLLGKTKAIRSKLKLHTSPIGSK